jgi:hypothetical protein
VRFPILAALTGLVLAAPVAAAAEPPSASVTAIAPVYAELAKRVLSDDHTDAKVDGLIAATLKALTEADSDVADLDRQYPGLVTAVGDAMRPLMLRGVAQTMPAYRADLAAMYARNLTPAEARTFADFLARPGPRAFFGSIASQMNYNSMANDLVAERDISSTSLSRDVRNTAKEVVAAATPEQVQEVQTFFATPLGKKLIALREQKSAVDLKWANADMPELEREMENLVTETMITHIGKTDPDLAKAMREVIAKDQAGNKTAG